MTSYWQNKPVMTDKMNKKNVLENIISQDLTYITNKTKIEEATSFNNQNELEKAYVIYKDILTENPENTGALLGIGIILVKQQKFDLAIQFLSRAIESDPDKSQALITRGRIFRLQGITERAISDFTRLSQGIQIILRR